MNTELTANELKVLTAIDNSEYGETLVDDIWTFSIEGNSDMSGKEISGTISSLRKKGFVGVGQDGKDKLIAMTRKGAALYMETNPSHKKPLEY